MLSERQVSEVVRPRLRVIETSDVDQAEAIASGRAEDASILRRTAVGLVVGILLGTPATCAIVAIALLLADSFTFGGMLAGVGGGILGGAYLGATVTTPGRPAARPVATRWSRPVATSEHRLVA